MAVVELCGLTLKGELIGFRYIDYSRTWDGFPSLRPGAKTFESRPSPPVARKSELINPELMGEVAVLPPWHVASATFKWLRAVLQAATVNNIPEDLQHACVAVFSGTLASFSLIEFDLFIPQVLWGKLDKLCGRKLSAR